MRLIKYHKPSARVSLSSAFRTAAVSTFYYTSRLQSIKKVFFLTYFRYMFFFEQSPKLCISTFRVDAKAERNMVSTLSNNADCDYLHTSNRRSPRHGAMAGSPRYNAHSPRTGGTFQNRSPALSPKVPGSTGKFTFDPEYGAAGGDARVSDPYGNRKAHFQEDRAVWKYKWALKDVELLSDDEMNDALSASSWPKERVNGGGSTLSQSTALMSKELLVGVKLSRAALAAMGVGPGGNSKLATSTDKIILRESTPARAAVLRESLKVYQVQWVYDSLVAFSVADEVNVC